jgi:hypothetical protein
VTMSKAIPITTFSGKDNYLDQRDRGKSNGRGALAVVPFDAEWGFREASADVAFPR